MSSLPRIDGFVAISNDQTVWAHSLLDKSTVINNYAWENIADGSPAVAYAANGYQTMVLADAAMRQIFAFSRAARKSIAETKFVELCCGNGAVAVQAAQMGADVDAVDINSIAIKTTEINSQENDVNLTARVQDIYNDNMGFAEGTKFDVIAVNPPCAPAFYERNSLTGSELTAINAGEKGVGHFAHIVENAGNLLSENGRLSIVVTSTMDLKTVTDLLDKNFPDGWRSTEHVEHGYAKVDSPTAYKARDAFENGADIITRDDNERILRHTWVVTAYKQPTEGIKKLTPEERIPRMPKYEDRIPHSAHGGNVHTFAR